MAKFKYVGATGELFTHVYLDEEDGYEWTWKPAGLPDPKQRFRLAYSNAAGEGYAGFAVCIRVGKKAKKVAE